METEVHRPNEINQKIYAMLAATEALKPATSQMTSPTNSKGSRTITSKVLSKVSSAWDRLNTKPPDLDGKDIEFDVSLPVPVISRGNRLSIKSIDIRQNEGINIGKNEKARKIAGIEVSRRPVPTDKKPFTNRPCAESGVCLTPSTVENEFLDTSGGSAWKLTAISSSPFGTEPRFESDLEYRVLSMKPDGFSTPRLRVDHRRRRLTSDSSMHSGERGATSNKQPHISDHSVTCRELFKTSTSKKGNRPKERHSTMSRTPSINYYLKPPDERKRVKKHPSPNKDYLERLKTALEQYTTLKTTGAGDRHLDELADMFSSPARPLAARDKNQSTRGRSAPRPEQKVGSKGGMKTHISGSPRGVCKYKIPRTSDVSEHNNPATRSVRTFRPRDEEADNTDELRD